MNRRTFLKRALGTLAGLVGISGGTYYYAREIEPYLLHIQKEVIASSKISMSYDGFKIVQFSDTHIGFHYSLEKINKIISQINQQEPDVIVFTGDLVDNPENYRWNKELIKQLKSLTASYGKYWIYGNHDHGGYGTNILKDTMDEADFKLLKNEHEVIELDNDRIIIAGVDDVILGNPSIEDALNGTSPDLFTLLLAHEPDYADTAINYPIDVQLSGHSHGGQVQLPFIGHLYTPAYAEKYVEGKYLLNHDQFTLFVNKGIGTTRLPYRFLCKPEIHVYTLQHKQ